MGLGLPVQLPNETYPGERGEVTGVLDVGSNGCFELAVEGASHFVIWPAGSGHAANQVRLPTGELVAEGQRVTGRGALTPTAPLIGNDDGYWAHAIGFCAPDAAEVLVLDEANLASEL
jgi:hypothetical protein